MAQTNYTPILLYASGTTGNAPSAGNMTSSASGAELALNYFDGKLFYKDNSGTVQVLATKATALSTVTNNGVVYVNSSGQATSGSALVFDGTNLGVGVTPSAGQGRLQVAGSSASWFKFYDSSSGYNFGTFYQSNGTSALGYIGSGGGAAITSGAYTDLALRAEANLLFASGGNTERMRIDSSGNLLVGTTTAGTDKVRFASAGASSNQLGLVSTDDASGNGYIQFRNSATTSIGSITRVGTTNAVIYNTSSDYRLKDVIGAVTGSGDRIDALEPIEYTWKSDGSRTRGFLAHEFQEIYPSSVTGSKDAVDSEGKPVYQAMQTSTPEVIADLIAEIQSLRKRLAALEAK